MRYLAILILSIFSIHSSYSQINELGVFVGGSNFIGDVGATNYISPNQLAIGGIYKWNRSPRHSYRISAIFTDLKGEDINSDDPRRLQRDYSFTNQMIEISAGMEFTFLDFNLHSGKKMSTPYLFSGISVSNIEDSYFISGVQTAQSSSSWAFGIPMVLGFKTNFLGNLILGIEVGARYTFSDNIDGSYPKDDALQAYRFGNQNNNDWYTFTGLTLTYTFGINPCYCQQ
jgi:opacity protein-like surface antigen